jgi:hypothetical protein
MSMASRILPREAIHCHSILIVEESVSQPYGHDTLCPLLRFYNRPEPREIQYIVFIQYKYTIYGVSWAVPNRPQPPDVP